jgi:hypothetical protein
VQEQLQVLELVPVLVQELERVQQLQESEYNKIRNQNRSVAMNNDLSKQKLTVPASY